MKYRILSALLRKSWAIDERYAISHGEIVADMLNRTAFEDEPYEAEEDKNSIPFAVHASAPGRRYSNFNDAPKDSIAVIPVRGPLMKDDEDDCGTLNAGMKTLGSRVKEADEHPNIKGTILYVDSPGGTVDGTQAFADMIKNTAKPVVSFVDGLMASAAFWVGSATNKIIAQNTTAEIGSIGVMVAFADMQPMWEQRGVKFHRINASQSSDKNKTYTDALKGDYKGIKELELDPLADMFIETVKANRPGVDKSAFTGRVYFAEEALRLGLIDDIGPIEKAIEAVNELAPDSNSPSASISTVTKTIETMNVPKLIALLNVAAIESTDDGVFLNAEQITAIEAAIVASDNRIAELTSELTAAGSQAATEIRAAEQAMADAQSARDAALAANTSTITALNEIHPDVEAAADVASKIEVIRTKLSERPGAANVGAKSGKDPEVNVDGVKWDVLNNLEHQKQLEELS